MELISELLESLYGSYSSPERKRAHIKCPPSEIRSRPDTRIDTFSDINKIKEELEHNNPLGFEFITDVYTFDTYIRKNRNDTYYIKMKDNRRPYQKLSKENLNRIKGFFPDDDMRKPIEFVKQQQQGTYTKKDDDKMLTDVFTISDLTTSRTYEYSTSYETFQITNELADISRMVASLELVSS